MSGARSPTGASAADAPPGASSKEELLQAYKCLESELSEEVGAERRAQLVAAVWALVRRLCRNAAASTHAHLLEWVHRHTFGLLLLPDWQKEKCAPLREQLESTLVDFERRSESGDEGLDWENALLTKARQMRRLSEDPWSPPVLRALLDPTAEQPTDDAVVGWLREERGSILVARVQRLTASRTGTPLALTLVAAVMERIRDPTGTLAARLKAEAGFTQDVIDRLTDMELVLLHRADNSSRCIQLMKEVPLPVGKGVVDRLCLRQMKPPPAAVKRLWKNVGDVATLAAQVMVTRCMVMKLSDADCGILYMCARNLGRLLPPERVRGTLSSLAQLAGSAAGLHCLALAAKTGGQDKALVCELYVRALNTGMNELERVKAVDTCSPEAILGSRNISMWLLQLADLLANNARVYRECVLTAFSVHPVLFLYEKVKACPLIEEDRQDTTPTESPRGFGSWACDSRPSCSTSFVKTSETIALSASADAGASAVSSAVLEGEGLGLEPVLCQDLAVLLSGPRIKTLHWKMDRDRLLENCKAYMERTEGGTRALPALSRYANMDPTQLEQLPYLDGDEEDYKNQYYGIEKGYEHLIEVEENSDSEQNEHLGGQLSEAVTEMLRIDDYTETETDDSDYCERPKPRPRNRNRAVIYSDDSDPLSFDHDDRPLVLERKKKNERPHSKDRCKGRSEDRTKSKSRKIIVKTDAVFIKEQVQSSRSESKDREISRSHSKEYSTSHKQSKEKEINKDKKRKTHKEKKHKEKKHRERISSQLVGVQVQKSETTGKNIEIMTDSDYDSQGRNDWTSSPEVTDASRIISYGQKPSINTSQLKTEVSNVNTPIFQRTYNKITKPKENTALNSIPLSYHDEFANAIKRSQQNNQRILPIETSSAKSVEPNSKSLQRNQTVIPLINTLKDSKPKTPQNRDVTKKSTVTTEKKDSPSQLINCKVKQLVTTVKNTPIVPLQPVKSLVNLHGTSTWSPQQTDPVAVGSSSEVVVKNEPTSISNVTVIKPMKSSVNLQGESNCLAHLKPVIRSNSETIIVTSDTTTNLQFFQPVKSMVNLQGTSICSPQEMKPAEVVSSVNTLTVNSDNIMATNVHFFQPVKSLVNLQGKSTCASQQIKPAAVGTSLETLIINNDNVVTTNVLFFQPVRSVVNLQGISTCSQQTKQAGSSSETLIVESHTISSSSLPFCQPIKSLVNLQGTPPCSPQKTKPTALKLSAESKQLDLQLSRNKSKHNLVKAKISDLLQFRKTNTVTTTPVVQTTNTNLLQTSNVHSISSHSKSQSINMDNSVLVKSNIIKNTLPCKISSLLQNEINKQNKIKEERNLTIECQGTVYQPLHKTDVIEKSLKTNQNALTYTRSVLKTSERNINTQQHKNAIQSTSNVIRQHSSHVSPVKEMQKIVNPNEPGSYINLQPQSMAATVSQTQSDSVSAQNNYLMFVKELRETNNAGAIQTSTTLEKKSDTKTENYRKGTNIIRESVTLNSPQLNTVSENKALNTKVSQKAPNTFARRNYMHKTKQNDTKQKFSTKPSQVAEGVNIQSLLAHSRGVESAVNLKNVKNSVMLQNKTLLERPKQMTSSLATVPVLMNILNSSPKTRLNVDSNLVNQPLNLSPQKTQLNLNDCKDITNLLAQKNRLFSANKVSDFTQLKVSVKPAIVKDVIQQNYTAKTPPPKRQPALPQQRLTNNTINNPSTSKFVTVHEHISLKQIPTKSAVKGTNTSIKKNLDCVEINVKQPLKYYSKSKIEKSSWQSVCDELRSYQTKRIPDEIPVSDYSTQMKKENSEISKVQEKNNTAFQSESHLAYCNDSSDSAYLDEELDKDLLNEINESIAFDRVEEYLSSSVKSTLPLHSEVNVILNDPQTKHNKNVESDNGNNQNTSFEGCVRGVRKQSVNSQSTKNATSSIQDTNMCTLQNNLSHYKYEIQNDNLMSEKGEFKNIARNKNTATGNKNLNKIKIISDEVIVFPKQFYTESDSNKISVDKCVMKQIDQTFTKYRTKPDMPEELKNIPLKLEQKKIIKDSKLASKIMSLPEINITKTQKDKTSQNIIPLIQSQIEDVDPMKKLNDEISQKIFVKNKCTPSFSTSTCNESDKKIQDFVNTIIDNNNMKSKTSETTVSRLQLKRNNILNRVHEFKNSVPIPLPYQQINKEYSYAEKVVSTIRLRSSMNAKKCTSPAVDVTVSDKFSERSVKKFAQKNNPTTNKFSEKVIVKKDSIQNMRKTDSDLTNKINDVADKPIVPNTKYIEPAISVIGDFDYNLDFEEQISSSTIKSSGTTKNRVTVKENKVEIKTKKERKRKATVVTGQSNITKAGNSKKQTHTKPEVDESTNAFTGIDKYAPEKGSTDDTSIIIVNKEINGSNSQRTGSEAITTTELVVSQAICNKVTEITEQLNVTKATQSITELKNNLSNNIGNYTPDNGSRKEQSVTALKNKKYHSISQRTRTGSKANKANALPQSQSVSNTIEVTKIAKAGKSHKTTKSKTKAIESKNNISENNDKDTLNKNTKYEKPIKKETIHSIAQRTRIGSKAIETTANMVSQAVCNEQLDENCQKITTDILHSTLPDTKPLQASRDSGNNVTIVDSEPYSLPSQIKTTPPTTFCAKSNQGKVYEVEMRMNRPVITQGIGSEKLSSDMETAKKIAMPKARQTNVTNNMGVIRASSLISKPNIIEIIEINPPTKCINEQKLTLQINYKKCKYRVTLKCNDTETDLTCFVATPQFQSLLSGIGEIDKDKPSLFRLTSKNTTKIVTEADLLKQIINIPQTKLHETSSAGMLENKVETSFKHKKKERSIDRKKEKKCTSGVGKLIDNEKEKFVTSEKESNVDIMKKNSNRSTERRVDTNKNTVFNEKEKNIYSERDIIIEKEKRLCIDKEKDIISEKEISIDSEKNIFHKNNRIIDIEKGGFIVGNDKDINVDIEKEIGVVNEKDRIVIIDTEKGVNEDNRSFITEKKIQKEARGLNKKYTIVYEKEKSVANKKENIDNSEKKGSMNNEKVLNVQEINVRKKKVAKKCREMRVEWDANDKTVSEVIELSDDEDYQQYSTLTVNGRIVCKLNTEFGTFYINPMSKHLLKKHESVLKKKSVTSIQRTDLVSLAKKHKLNLIIRNDNKKPRITNTSDSDDKISSINSAVTTKSMYSLLELKNEQLNQEMDIIEDLPEKIENVSDLNSNRAINMKDDLCIGETDRSDLCMKSYVGDKLSTGKSNKIITQHTDLTYFDKDKIFSLFNAKIPKVNLEKSFSVEKDGTIVPFDKSIECSFNSEDKDISLSTSSNAINICNESNIQNYADNDVDEEIRPTDNLECTQNEVGFDTNHNVFTVVHCVLTDLVNSVCEGLYLDGHENVDRKDPDTNVQNHEISSNLIKEVVSLRRITFNKVIECYSRIILSKSDNKLMLFRDGSINSTQKSPNVSNIHSGEIFPNEIIATMQFILKGVEGIVNTEHKSNVDVTRLSNKLKEKNISAENICDDLNNGKNAAVPFTRSVSNTVLAEEVVINQSTEKYNHESEQEGNTANIEYKYNSCTPLMEYKIVDNNVPVDIKPNSHGSPFQSNLDKICVNNKNHTEYEDENAKCDTISELGTSVPELNSIPNSTVSDHFDVEHTERVISSKICKNQGQIMVSVNDKIVHNNNCNLVDKSSSHNSNYFIDVQSCSPEPLEDEIVANKSLDTKLDNNVCISQLNLDQPCLHSENKKEETMEHFSDTEGQCSLLNQYEEDASIVECHTGSEILETTEARGKHMEKVLPILNEFETSISENRGEPTATVSNNIHKKSFHFDLEHKETSSMIHDGQEQITMSADSESVSDNNCNLGDEILSQSSNSFLDVQSSLSVPLEDDIVVNNVLVDKILESNVKAYQSNLDRTCLHKENKEEAMVHFSDKEEKSSLYQYEDDVSLVECGTASAISATTEVRGKQINNVLLKPTLIEFGTSIPEQHSILAVNLSNNLDKLSFHLDLEHTETSSMIHKGQEQITTLINNELGSDDNCNLVDESSSQNPNLKVQSSLSAPLEHETVENNLLVDTILESKANVYQLNLDQTCLHKENKNEETMEHFSDEKELCSALNQYKNDETLVECGNALAISEKTEVCGEQMENVLLTPTIIDYGTSIPAANQSLHYDLEHTETSSMIHEGQEQITTLINNELVSDDDCNLVDESSSQNPNSYLEVQSSSPAPLEDEIVVKKKMVDIILDSNVCPSQSNLGQPCFDNEHKKAETIEHFSDKEQQCSTLTQYKDHESLIECVNAPPISETTEVRGKQMENVLLNPILNEFGTIIPKKSITLTSTVSDNHDVELQSYHFDHEHTGSVTPSVIYADQMTVSVNDEIGYDNNCNSADESLSPSINLINETQSCSSEESIPYVIICKAEESDEALSVLGVDIDTLPTVSIERKSVYQDEEIGTNVSDVSDELLDQFAENCKQDVSIGGDHTYHQEFEDKSFHKSPKQFYPYETNKVNTNDCNELEHVQLDDTQSSQNCPSHQHLKIIPFEKTDISSQEVVVNIYLNNSKEEYKENSCQQEFDDKQSISCVQSLQDLKINKAEKTGNIINTESSNEAMINIELNSKEECEENRCKELQNETFNSFLQSKNECPSRQDMDIENCKKTDNILYRLTSNVNIKQNRKGMYNENSCKRDLKIEKEYPEDTNLSSFKQPSNEMRFNDHNSVIVTSTENMDLNYDHYLPQSSIINVADNRLGSDKEKQHDTPTYENQSSSSNQKIKNSVGTHNLNIIAEKNDYIEGESERQITGDVNTKPSEETRVSMNFIMQDKELNVDRNVDNCGTSITLKSTIDVINKNRKRLLVKPNTGYMKANEDDFDNFCSKLLLSHGGFPSKRPRLELDSSEESMDTRSIICSQEIITPCREKDYYDNMYENSSSLKEEIESFVLRMPSKTYSRQGILKNKNITRENNLKEKKYRKGKCIDYPKLTKAVMDSSSCTDVFNKILQYNSSVKLSNWQIFSRCSPKELDVENPQPLFIFSNKNPDITKLDLENKSHSPLFEDLDPPESERYDIHKWPDCITDLAENISADTIREFMQSDTGFGEESDRVIVHLQKDDISKVSAATLSDVKHQPLKQVEVNSENESQSFVQPLKAQVSLKSLSYMVQSYFDNLVMKNIHLSKINACKTFVNIPGLYSTDFLEPQSMEQIVNVVQVGQLPVSATAQNPVSCEPRVSQATNVSPSQCSVDNSPGDGGDNSRPNEYIELTNANLNFPIVQSPHEAKEITDHSDDSKTERDYLELQNVAPETYVTQQNCDYTSPVDKVNSENHTEKRSYTPNSQEMQQDLYGNEEPKFNSIPAQVSTQPPVQFVFTTSQSVNNCESFNQHKENGSSEKNDQIANAMTAAGIATSTPRTQTLVNILSQKIIRGPTVNNVQQNNSYSKTSINTMAIQQALAQILPPINQNNHSDSSGPPTSGVGPQVLHIIQGKNSSGNQITLVENNQSSVINSQGGTAQVLHIVPNKNNNFHSTNGSQVPTTTFSGISLVDAGIQQGGNQLLHIVNSNTNQNKTNNLPNTQLLKRVNLLTSLANMPGNNDQKMVQFVCKSADGKAIQLNSPHQRGMVLRLHPIETPPPNVTVSKSDSVSPSTTVQVNAVITSKDSIAQQEIKSRSIYEENYAKFIQSSGDKPLLNDRNSTIKSLPKFNQAFGKTVYQETSMGKQDDISHNGSQLNINNNDHTDIPQEQNTNTVNVDNMGQINSPPLIIRKAPQTTQSQQNLVQQIKQAIAPMNIQTMHGGVIYTRQIPVNLGGGQTINLITVPSTELIDDNSQKQMQEITDQQPIIKIIPQLHQENGPEETEHVSASEPTPPTQSQPVLTQMRIKLPMLSKTPQVVPGARVVRPFLQIQRNVIAGTNQPVYQQLVLTTTSPLGQQTIRLPTPQQIRQVKIPQQTETNLSTSTLEQLREFDMVLEQVKERSTVQPSPNGTPGPFTTLQSQSESQESTVTVATLPALESQQVLYSIGSNQALNVAYVNRKPITTSTTFVRSPDSSGITDSPTSSQMCHSVSDSSTDGQGKSTKIISKSSKSRPHRPNTSPNAVKVPPVAAKTSIQKPLEDEQTTQRILYILAEYKEQVENSPDKDKPAPRRRSNPPTNPSGNSKRKKSSGGSRRSGRDSSPVSSVDDPSRTMGSEDSSCGTSQGDCTESCVDVQSPQDSPRKISRKLSFEDASLSTTPPRPQQRNLIVADGQTIAVTRSAGGKPATAVLMPANYLLPVSMVKGGQQIAIVTNRGPKILTMPQGEGGAANALLLQRLISPAALKPMLARPGVRHLRLPTAALHNLQAFNIAAVSQQVNVESNQQTSTEAAESTDAPDSSPWREETGETRAEESCSGSEAGDGSWRTETQSAAPAADPAEYAYDDQQMQARDSSERTVLGQMPDQYSPEMDAQQIFEKMFVADGKKCCGSPQATHHYDMHSDCEEKIYQPVVHKKEGGAHAPVALRPATHSAAALRHKYAVLEHELRLQKSLSEECEDLGVDSPSAAELFPEAELLFADSPAHEQHEHPAQHPQAPPHLAIEQEMEEELTDLPEPTEAKILGLGLGAALDHEEFARAHPNTTFHSEPTEEEVQPFTIAALKGRHITSAIFHPHNTSGATVLMTGPAHTVISHVSQEEQKYSVQDIESMMTLPTQEMPSVLVKDDGLTRFDNILMDSRELHLSNAAPAIVHSSSQVIRRVGYDIEKDSRDSRFSMDETDAIAGEDAKMSVAEDSSRDATLESMAGDADDDRSSPERHVELFWESNSASERSECRRPLDFSSDSDKCCKSPFDETNSTDSSIGRMRLDSVIKEARRRDRPGSGASTPDDNHPPVRTYPAKRIVPVVHEGSTSGKTRAMSPTEAAVRRRASSRGVVKRGCHCCNGSPEPVRPKKIRKKSDFTNAD